MQFIFFLVGGWLTIYKTTKIFDWSKLKALADDKIYVVQQVTFVCNRVKNNVGKGENAGN